MKRISLIACALIAFALVSCSEDAEDLQMDENQMEESQDQTGGTPVEEGDFTQAEVQTIIETDDFTSRIDTILSEIYFENGTTSKSSNDCYSVEYFENGFVATFNNCALNETENANGTVNVSYGLGDSSATYTATYADFFIGTIKVNGTRSYTVTGTENESVSFEISSNINLEYEDGTVISESGTKVFSFIFEEGQDTLWNLQGTWMLQKDGNTYTIGGNVSTSLTCEYWTQGSMNISVNDLVVDIDFGDGTCDDQAVLTYADGSTQNITL